jgi:hypothetical protein
MYGKFSTVNSVDAKNFVRKDSLNAEKFPLQRNQAKKKPAQRGAG